MRRTPRLLLAAAMLLLLPGCFKMDIDATGLQPGVYMSLEQGAQTPEQMGSFETTETASWLLWGLVPLGEPDIEDALEREIRRANGSAVTGLEITTQQTFVDGLIQAVTLGIFGRRTTILTGTVVR